MLEGEKEIIIRASKGDKSSFEWLVLKYQKKLYGFIYNILHDEHEALDLVQETFVRAYKSLGSFDNSKVFSTWLFTIARNLSLNSIKANKKYVLEEELNLKGDLDTPEEAFIKNEETRRLYDGIEELPEKYKELIYLKYAEGLSYEEISKRLGTTTVLVESRLYMARRRLANILSGGM